MLPCFSREEQLRDPGEEQPLENRSRVGPGLGHKSEQRSTRTAERWRCGPSASGVFQEEKERAKLKRCKHE